MKHFLTARAAVAGGLLVAALVVGGGCRSAGSRPPAIGRSPEGASPADALRRPAWRWIAPPPSYVGMPGVDASAVAVTYGHSSVVLLEGGNKARWAFDAPLDGPALRDVAPRLTAENVVVATEEGVINLDRATGAVRWDVRLGEQPNAPLVAAGRVVVSTWEGALVGLDLANGKVVWREPLPGEALGPAAGDDHLVVVTWEAPHGAGAGMVAVDPATGRRRWSAELSPGGVSGPTLVRSPAGAVVVAVAADLAAHGLAADSGAERWRAPLEGAGSPEVVPIDAGGGNVLVAHRLGGMALLDAGDGRARWSVSSDGAAVRGGPAGPGPNGLFALPLDDGRLLLAGPGQPHRVVDPPGRVSGVVSGPDGVLLVATREAIDNDLTAFSDW